MKVFLIISMLLPGQGWVAGNDLDGWSDREQPSWEVCEKRLDKMQKPPHATAWIVMCVKRRT